MSKSPYGSLRTAASAEEFRQLPQIAGAELDGDLHPLVDRPRVARTVAGQQNPRRLRGRGDVASDPGRGHQGGHRNRHHGHGIVEPGRLCSAAPRSTASACSASRPVTKWMCSRSM